MHGRDVFPFAPSRPTTEVEWRQAGLKRHQEGQQPRAATVSIAERYGNRPPRDRWFPARFDGSRGHHRRQNDGRARNCRPVVPARSGAHGIQPLPSPASNGFQPGFEGRGCLSQARTPPPGRAPRSGQRYEPLHPLTDTEATIIEPRATKPRPSIPTPLGSHLASGSRADWLIVLVHDGDDFVPGAHGPLIVVMTADVR